MEISSADINDAKELYRLQRLSFESETQMVGSRDLPALTETEEENIRDFGRWSVLKITDGGKIVGAVRYRHDGGAVEIGRLMVHPDYRRRGLAQRLLSEVDKLHPHEVKELYTCTKSLINIRLYEKMGYVPYAEHAEESGLSFVHMRKC